jgi:hypothetical protein
VSSIADLTEQLSRAADPLLLNPAEVPADDPQPLVVRRLRGDADPVAGDGVEPPA